MQGEKRPRYFIRNPDGESVWCYCGDIPADLNTAELERAFGAFMVGELCGHPDPRVNFEVKREMMTDAEVAEIPEM